ncbi:MAG TPA: hypothetical protein PLD02_14565, partial [Saprospiraceae bacterium]|nr:hypothetical protein [Saprospiraceae bacterium]
PLSASCRRPARASARPNTPVALAAMDQNDMQIHLVDDRIDHNVLITLNYENQLQIMGNN